MNGVEKINLIQKNTNFRANEKQSEPQKQSKNYFTAPNLILGSLATVGILGLADVLICKGKHINKLTGKAKELEEAATRTETRIAELEENIRNLEEQISHESERIFNSPIHKTQRGNGFLKNMYHIYNLLTDNGSSEALKIAEKIKKHFNSYGYKLLDYKPEIASNFEKSSSASVNKIVTTEPTLIHEQTGDIIARGVAVFPMN